MKEIAAILVLCACAQRAPAFLNFINLCDGAISHFTLCFDHYRVAVA